MQVVLEVHELHQAPQAVHIGVVRKKLAGLHCTQELVELPIQQRASANVPVPHEPFDNKKPVVHVKQIVADEQVAQGAVHAVHVVLDKKYPEEHTVPAAAAVHVA